MMWSAVHLDASVANGLEQWDMAETHMRKCFDLGLDFQVHLVAGIEEAKIDFGTLQHEPVRTVLVLTKSNEDNDPLVGQRVLQDHSPKRPHEKVGVEIFVGEILARPLVPHVPSASITALSSRPATVKRYS